MTTAKSMRIGKAWLLSITGLALSQAHAGGSRPASAAIRPGSASMGPASDSVLTHDAPSIEIKGNGPRLTEAASSIRSLYPSMTRFEERAFVPAANGGSTFNGLVARLLGTSPDRETEGTQVRRFIYHVYTGDRKIGVVHGSTVGFEGRDLQVFVAYDLSGKLLDVRAAGLAQADLARLAPALEQFRGTDVADFEVIRGRKGRITSQGSFLTSAKRPTDARTRAIFERVVRAVRFNAAFMDVAVFIKEHPDLADDNRIALSEPVSGPEAFIRSREVATSNDPTVNPTERSSRSSRP